jgi:hypothetical protein
MAYALSVEQPWASVTRIVKAASWPVVGGPPIAPVEALRERPAGSVPSATAKENGAVPVELPTVCE